MIEIEYTLSKDFLDKDDKRVLKEYYKGYEKRIKTLVKENQQLKDIIKEVREYIGSKEHYEDDFDTEIEKVYKILDKEKQDV